LLLFVDSCGFVEAPELFKITFRYLSLKLQLVNIVRYSNDKDHLFGQRFPFCTLHSAFNLSSNSDADWWGDHANSAILDAQNYEVLRRTSDGLSALKAGSINSALKILLRVSEIVEDLDKAVIAFYQNNNINPVMASFPLHILHHNTKL